MKSKEEYFKIIGIDKEINVKLNDNIVETIMKIVNSVDITIINKEIVDKLIKNIEKHSQTKISISLLFTYVWKISTFDNRNILFQILDEQEYNGIVCINNEYSTLATRSKYRRSAKRKSLVKKEDLYVDRKEKLPDFSNLHNLFNSLRFIGRLKGEDQNRNIKIFFETVIDKVSKIKNKQEQEIKLAEYLLSFPHTTIINNNINISALSDIKELNVTTISDMNRFINYYVKEKKLLSENERFRTLSYLFLYINFYLPIAYSLNMTDIKPLDSIDDFKGSYFISTPIPINKILPLSFLKFLDIAANIRSEKTDSFKYTILINVKDFFDEIISRKEAYNINPNFSNPILSSNIPKLNNLKESTKTRIPSEVFWLFIGTSKKIIKIVEEVNMAIINGKMTSNLLRNFIVNGELDLDLLNSKIKIDIEFEQNNKTIKIKKLRREIFSFIKYKLKSGRIVDIVNPLPLIQIAVALETGLRHQSLQWLSDDFDHRVPEKIEESEIYELFIKTDKSKMSSWYSFVSGRVINLLRSARTFKDLIDQPAFENEIPYDGHGKRWGSYKILFNYNPQTGFPYSDNLYTNRFKSILCCVDDLLEENGIDYKIYKNKSQRDKLSCDITPHSTRVTVVSELVNYLPPEYISRHITGHSTQTVTYYTKYDNNDIKNFKLKQKNGFNNKEKSDILSLAKIDQTTNKSNIVSSFENNYENALNDFGCSTIDDDAWTNLIDKKIEPTFSFEATHICPFSSICPKMVLEKKIDHQCFKCPYAIRSVDHLPALCAKRREIIEIITSIEDKLIENKLTNLNKLQLQEKRKNLAEELAYYSVIIQILDKKLNEMKEGDITYTTFKPDAIKQDLIKGYFPDDSDHMYVLSRLEEVNNYPDFETPEINARIKYLTTKLLVASGNLRELIKEEYHGDKSSLYAYSLIKSLISSKQITQDDLIKISKTDVTKFQNEKFLLEKHNAE